jgi:acyl carrier protein
MSPPSPDAATVERAAAARVGAIFAQHLHVEVPSLDADLFDAGLLDSLSLVALMAHLEREFGIAIDLVQLDVAQFRSLRTIAEFVVRAG